MDNCNFCGHSDIKSIKNFGKHPIAHNLLIDPEEKVDVYSMHLVYCKHCSLIQLDKPIEPHKFYSNYFTVSSWKPQPHIPKLIDTLLNHFQLSLETKVIEVGSNDGIFLKALREQGMTNLLGIEPAQDARTQALESGIETVGEYFNSSTAIDIADKHGKHDFFVSRQNLEHIEDLVSYADGMRAVLNDQALVLIEVPYFNCNLLWSDYSIWEEHVNYFTENTLRNFFEMANIEVLHQDVTLFSGETLIFYGRYHENSLKYKNRYLSNDNEIELIEHYSNCADNFISDMESFLLDFKSEEGKKIALYGAGARATSFLNFLNLAKHIDFVLDDQVEKQDKFLPGESIPIISGKEINSRNIGLVLLGVNTEIEDKVIDKHQDFIDAGGKFYSILPPSKKLPPFWEDYVIEK